MHWNLPVLLATAGLAACVGGHTVTASDSGVSMPTARFAARSFELEATHVAGKSHGGQVDYDVDDLQFLLRYPLPIQSVAITPLFGFEGMHLRIDDTATPELNGFTSGGFAAGIEIRRETFTDLFVYGRGTASWLFQPLTSSRVELGGAFAVADRLEVFGGYRWWRMHETSDNASASDGLTLHTEGLVFGLGLRF
jgi:hypothetical protein